MQTLRHWVTRKANETLRSLTSDHSTPLRPRALVLLLISLATLSACAAWMGTPVRPVSDELAISPSVPCSDVPLLPWAPGEVDETVPNLVDASREKAVAHVAAILASIDRSRPTWRAEALFAIREIVGDPDDIVTAIKIQNAAIAAVCPPLTAPAK